MQCPILLDKITLFALGLVLSQKFLLLQLPNWKVKKSILFVDCMPNPTKPTTELAYNPTTSKGMARVTILLHRDQK